MLAKGAASRPSFSGLALVLAGCLSALAVSSANAGFVATDVPVTTSDFGYLSSSLHPILAVDLNGPGETINGVTFGPGGMTGGVGVTYSVSSTPDPENTYPNSNGFNAGANSAPDSAQINLLLGGFFYPGSNFVNGIGFVCSPETVTIGGLTPGHPYTLTLLDSAFGAGATGARAETLTGLDGAVIHYQENNGAFSTLAYTAVANSLGNIGFTSTADDLTDGLHLYGFTVVSVPEPTSVILLGLGALALFACRRRA